MNITLAIDSLKRCLLPTLFFLMLVGAPSFAGGVSTYTLKADGLACPFCAYGIEKQLGKIDGVETVTTDITSGTVLVVMAEDAVLERQDAEQAVTKAGFTLAGFTRNPDPQ